MRLLITNGHVVDPANDIDTVCDVAIADGVIVSVGTVADGFQSQQVIDASRHVVCPGLVDVCARLREPGQEPKADIASETTAAAHAGITTLCVPPDTDPVIDTPAVAELVRRHAKHAGKAKVVTLGALTQDLQGEALAEMAALKEAGCVGVSNACHPVVNTLVLRRAMDYAATHALTVFIKPMDFFLSQGGCAHEGPVSARLGLPGISEATETIAVARDLVLIEQTGVRAHFCQLSSAKAVNIIGRAQYAGLPVTADVTGHHLHLTEMDIADFNNHCHVIPPLRSQRDRDGLRDGVKQGVIGAICSDHQPHEDDVKLAPFCATAPGMSALETLLPLALRLREQNMSMSKIIARLTHIPARILNVPAGTLSPGQAADICIFDPDRYWTVQSSQLVSRGRNTPFLNWELQGRVTHTLLDGHIVYSPAGHMEN